MWHIWNVNELVVLDECGVFAIASGYADDLKLLTVSMKALTIVATISVHYADKYDVLLMVRKPTSYLQMYMVMTSRSWYCYK